jgi:hypothetical protein
MHNVVIPTTTLLYVATANTSMKTQGGRLLHAAANAAAWKALALLSAHAAQAGPALGVRLCIESGTLLVVPDV